MVATALFVPGHMFGWALEWGWLLLQFLVAGVILVVSRDQLRATAGVPALVWAAVFLSATVVGCLGTFYGNATLGIPLEIADAADLLRFLIFIPLSLYIGIAVRPEHLDSIVRLFKICIIFNLMCSAILVFHIAPLFDIVLAIYREAKVQYDITHIRIGIPFVNPNFAALLFVMMLSIFLFFEKSILYSTLAVLAIILTGSRSGYIAAAPLLLLAYGQFILRALRNWKQGISLVALHIGVIWLYSNASDSFDGFGRLNELLNALQGRDLGQVNTASIRFDLIKNALQFIDQSPLVGVGPGRSLGLDVVDSQILAWPLNYGVPVAAMLYGLFLAPMLILTWQARTNSHRLAALATALAFFLMLGTGDFMKNYRLFFLVLVMMQCILFSTLQRDQTSNPRPYL